MYPTRHSAPLVAKTTLEASGTAVTVNDAVGEGPCTMVPPPALLTVKPL
jgi:hypothetical protein